MSSENILEATINNDTTICDTELETLCTSQNDNNNNLTKQRTVEEDEHDGLFINTTYLEAGKRKGKISELPYESISFDVYQQKKCGFLTKRPVAWAKALETYIDETSDVEARWLYKEDKGKHVECEITLYFQRTKKVVVTISIQSGTIFVKGQHFKEWMNSTFQILLGTINNGSRGVKNGSEASVVEKEKVKVEEPVNEDLVDINKLWQECAALKSSLCTLEKSVANLIQSNLDFSDLLERKNKEIDQKVKSLESMYDNKLAVFMSAISIDCQDMITRNCTAIREDILGQKKNMSKIESRFQKSVNQIQNSVSKRCECPENTPKWVRENAVSMQQSLSNDIEHLRTLHESTESKLQSIPLPVADNTKPKDVSTDIDTLTSRCNILDAKVDSISTAVSGCAKSHEVSSIKEEVKIAQHNISKIIKSSQSAEVIAPCNMHDGENIINKDATSLPEEVARDAAVNTELLVCMDSNQKFIDHGRFWKLRGTVWKKTTRLEHIESLFTETSFNGLKAVLICCGVNDTDSKPGREVAERLIEIVNNIKADYPTVKIILSEVTPRKDGRDGEVRKCNVLLGQFMNTFEDGVLVMQDNLRDANWSMFHDTKHIKKHKMPKFVWNLKQGLRLALNVPTSKDASQGVQQYVNFHPDVQDKTYDETYDAYVPHQKTKPDANPNMYAPPPFTQQGRLGKDNRFHGDVSGISSYANTHLSYIEQPRCQNKYTSNVPTFANKYYEIRPGTSENINKNVNGNHNDYTSNTFSNKSHEIRPGTTENVIHNANGNHNDYMFMKQNLLLRLSEAIRNM